MIYRISPVRVPAECIANYVYDTYSTTCSWDASSDKQELRLKIVAKADNHAEWILFTSVVWICMLDCR
jgi:hypothetical protein